MSALILLQTTLGPMSQEKLMFINALPDEQKQSRIDQLQTMEGTNVPSGPYPHQLKNGDWV